MSKSNQISIENDFFYLSVFNKLHLTKTRREHFAKLLSVYHKTSKILTFIPGVCAFSLCNSLALRTCNETSDIDLFIILKKESFFTTRLLIIAIFNLFRLRPKVCLSFFISNQALNLDNIRLENDIYFSHWLDSLSFYTSDIDLINQFNTLNNSKSTICDQFKFKNNICLFESLLKRFQLKRANKKQSKLQLSYGVIINSDMLKFHHRDIRKKFNPAFIRQYDAFLQGNRVKTYQQSLQEE